MHRLADMARSPVSFRYDGIACTALAGDTVLTAILTQPALAHGETIRAGFCLMGACQACLVERADGSTLRACSREVVEGMEIFSRTRGAA